jgi:hypothetical protein
LQIFETKSCAQATWLVRYPMERLEPRMIAPFVSTNVEGAFKARMSCKTPMPGIWPGTKQRDRATSA